MRMRQAEKTKIQLLEHPVPDVLLKLTGKIDSIAKCWSSSIVRISLLTMLAAGIGAMPSNRAAAQAGPGLTESQAITFKAIEDHCGKTREILSSLSEQEKAWSDSCWALVTTNNAIRNVHGISSAIMA